MKIQFCMKNPDVISESIKDAVISSIEEKAAGLSDRQKELIYDDEEEEIKKKLSKFIEFGEYITVEIDTDTQTARVVPVE